MSVIVGHPVSEDDIRIRKQPDGSTCVDVEIRLLSNYVIESSSVCGHPDCDRWPASFKKAIDRRRHEGGETKGRVLYLRQIQWPSQARLVVGGLLYHLDDHVLRVTGLEPTTDRHPSQARIDRGALLHGAQRMSNQLGFAGVEWLVHSEADAKSACGHHAFRRLRRNDRRCSSLRANEILLERRHQEK